MATNPGNNNTNGGAGPVSAAEPNSAPSPATTITAAAPSLIQNQLMQNNPQLINLLQQQQALAQQQQPATVTTQQYIPTAGPFYTLQQQQAFAQARLAALAAQSQAALQQKITTSMTTTTQQQGASSSNQVAGGQQIVGGQQQQYIYSQPAVYSNIMSQQQIQPQIQLQQNPNISVIGGVSNVIAQQPQMNPVSSTATTVTATTTSMSKGSSKTIVPPSSSKSISPSEKQSSSIPTTTTSPTQQTLGTSGMSSTATKLIQNALEESNKCELPPNPTPPASSSATSPYNPSQTVEEKKQSARDRNREHAKCTRLRKKAYVNKLKELVDGLHAERNEDERKRRVEVQKLAEMHETRRQVVHTFLGYHASYESDPSKWSRILETGDGKEDGEVFKLKQPVTPYRSFSRCEIQKVRRHEEILCI